MQKYEHLIFFTVRNLWKLNQGAVSVIEFYPLGFYPYQCEQTPG